MVEGEPPRALHVPRPPARPARLGEGEGGVEAGPEEAQHGRLLSLVHQVGHLVLGQQVQTQDLRIWEFQYMKLVTCLTLSNWQEGSGNTRSQSCHGEPHR